MPRQQVSIRLATDGKAQVQRDFADIGSSGDASAQRIAASYERAANEADASLAKLQKAQERLATVSSTPRQFAAETAAGVHSTSNNSAKESARALAEQLDRAENEARQLLAAIDPLFAAEQRYIAQVERINAVKATGQLTEEQYQRLLANEKVLLDQSTAAAQRNAQMRGTLRIGMQQLSFQAGDVATQMALGTQASVIFAQQSGQTIQALQLMGGEGNKFLRFLGGPWGLAITTAAVVLTPLVGKLLEAKDETAKLVDELVKQEQKTRASAAAQSAFERTIDGSIAKMRDLTKELKDQNLTLEDNIKLKKAAIAGSLANVASNIGEVSTKLAEAVQRQKDAERLLSQIESGALNVGDNPAAAIIAAAAQVEQAKAEVKDLTNQLNSLSKSANAGAIALRAVDFPLLERRAKEAVDPIAKINREFDDMATKAKKAAEGNDTLKNSLQATLTDIEKRRKAALDAQKLETRDLGDLTRFGSPVSGGSITGRFGEKRPGHNHAGVDFGVPVGTNVSAVAGGTVIEIGSLPGYGNTIIIDHGRGTTTRYAHLSQLMVSKGQQVGQGDLIGLSGGAKGAPGAGNSEGPHLHFEVRRGGRAVNPAAGSFPTDPAMAGRGAIRSAESAAEKAARQINDFEERRARLSEQLVSVQNDLLSSYQAQSDAAVLGAKAEHDRVALGIQNDLAEGKFGEATSEAAKARATELLQINDAIETQKLANQTLKDRLHDMQEADKTASQAAQFQIDALDHQDKIARTAKEHRDLQLQIVDIVYDEKKRHLEYLLALATLAGETEEAARIQAELNDLPKQKGRAQDDARDGTMSPGEAYLKSLPKLSELGGQMEEIGVEGMKRFNSELLTAIMNAKSFKDLWKNLGGVVHSVAQQILQDLIDLAIKSLIIRPIMELIKGSGGLGFASGTQYAPGGMAWVGENGPELIALPRGSRVHTASASRRMAEASNDNGTRFSLTFHNDFRGADPAAVASIEQRLNQMEAELPGRVVHAYQDAKQRFVIR